MIAIVQQCATHAQAVAISADQTRFFVCIAVLLWIMFAVLAHLANPNRDRS